MGNFRVTGPLRGEFPEQRPVTRSFDVSFDLHLNKRLSKLSWGWWFEMPSNSLWCHCSKLRETGQVYVTCIQIISRKLNIRNTVHERYSKVKSSLQWRHNGRDGVSNQQRDDCLLIRLFRCRSKKSSKLRFTDRWIPRAKGSVTRKMFPFDDVII